MARSISSLIGDLIETRHERPEKVPRGRRGPRQLTPREPPVGAICDTCAFNKYFGIMEVKREFGECDLWNHTKRLCNRWNAEACQLYRPKTLAKLAAEKEYATIWLAEICEMNRKMYGKGRPAILAKQHQKETGVKKRQKANAKVQHARNVAQQLLGGGS